MKKRDIISVVSKYESCRGCMFIGTYVRNNGYIITCSRYNCKFKPVEQQPPRTTSQAFIYEIFLANKDMFTLDSLLWKFFKITSEYEPTEKELEHYYIINSGNQHLYDKKYEKSYSKVNALDIINDCKYSLKTNPEWSEDKKIAKFMIDICPRLENNENVERELQKLYNIVKVDLEDVKNRKYDYLLPDDVLARIYPYC